MADDQAFGTSNYPLWIKLKEKMSCKRLGFLISLDKDIDYKRITCSMGKLQELMDVLGVDYSHFTKKITKHEVVQYYRDNAAPIVDNFIISMGLNLGSNSVLADTSPSTSPPLESDVIMTDSSDRIKLSNSNSLASPSNTTPASSTENIRTPRPTSKLNSKVEELCKGLEESVNNMVSRGFNKSALVKLQSHLKDKASSTPANFKAASNFRRPHRLPLKEISKKDRDTIQQALQFYCPQLWIPINVAISRPMLVALYNAFILEGDEPDLCRGVHYDIIPMEEMIFDDDLSFPSSSSSMSTSGEDE